MYDQVAQNKRRSLLLIGSFVVLVILVLEAFNLIIGGGPAFAVFAVLIAAGSAAFSYWKSDSIALRVSRAVPASIEEYGRLHNVVEGLCIAAGLPKPRIYVVDDLSPNAFATGRDPKHAAIAVTTGLLEKMNRVELEGVLAHELSHIKNYDILVSTLAVTMVGVIAIAADIGVRFLWFGMGRNRNNSNDSQNAGFTAVLAVFGFLLLVLSPLIGRAMQAAVSRKRETLADVSGCELTRYPPGLISALEKLRDDYTVVGSTSHATAHLWIEQPQAVVEDEGRMARINRMFDTHPPLEERIALLREPDPGGLLLQSRNQRIAAAVVGAVVVIGGVAAALALSGGKDEPVATTTTTTSTTTTVPPTTAPPRLAPLTGLPINDPGVPDRIALVVKIDNVEPKSRPQIGLNQADVVYEERVEGSVTRLLAIFDSQGSAPVGPVRSARTSDIAILSMLHKPYFAWSGANSIFAQRVRAANIIDVGYDAHSEQYFREGSRHAPDNLMLKSTADIQKIPHPGSTPPVPLFPYRAAGQTTARLNKVSGVRITYGSSAGSAPVEYRWNGKGWARTQKGTPHVDVAGVQVAPENVIVQFVDYKPTDVGDQFGVPIPEAQLVGDGDAWILTQGGLVNAHWHKPSPEAITTYTDLAGHPVLLTPGRTWIALPPKGEASRL